MNSEQKKFIRDLYHTLYPFLVRYADSSLNNTALSEEAVQEAFSIACAKPTDVCSSPNFKGWMVNTVAYVIKNIERRQRSVQQVIADLPEYRLDFVATPPQSIDLHLLYGDLAETKEFKRKRSITTRLATAPLI